MTPLLLLLVLSTALAVEIHELVVPGVVEEGSENVLLDCNFSYNESETDQLEIKWYFNRDPTPFCQWIAGVPDTRPQLIGAMFEDKVDLEYVGGSTNQTKYRALLLHRPTTAMAGTYTCKVSTLESEAVAEARMQVYSPAASSVFRQSRVGGSKVNISCSFGGIFPLPSLKLTWGSFDLFEDALTVTPNDGAFDVTIHKTLEHRELPAETVFGCELFLPGTEYFVREEAIYHHRGRRNVEMSKIAELEEIRRRKSKVFYNTDSRLAMEEVAVNSLEQLTGDGPGIGPSLVLSLASLTLHRL
jgi:hypothetical protein